MCHHSIPLDVGCSENSATHRSSGKHRSPYRKSLQVKNPVYVVGFHSTGISELPHGSGSCNPFKGHFSCTAPSSCITMIHGQPLSGTSACVGDLSPPSPHPATRTAHCPAMTVSTSICGSLDGNISVNYNWIIFKNYPPVTLSTLQASIGMCSYPLCWTQLMGTFLSWRNARWRILPIRKLHQHQETIPVHPEGLKMSKPRTKLISVFSLGT